MTSRTCPGPAPSSASASAARSASAGSASAGSVPWSAPRPARAKRAWAGLAAAGAVGLTALLGVASAAVPAAASEAGGAPGVADTTRPRDAVTLTPASAGAGTTVSVRALCASPSQDGAVFSPAFAHAAALRRAPDGTMVAEATVQPGLPPGRGYVVTANCSATESLTTTFVSPSADRHPAAVPPAGPAGHAVPATYGARGEIAGGPVDGVALAFGGGLATAALAGYVLTTRRIASRRRAPVVSSSGVRP